MGPQEAKWWRGGISLFDRLTAPRPAPRRVSWAALCASLTRFRSAPSKDAVPLWSPASYPEGCEARRKAHVVSVSCLVLDYDDGTTIGEAHRAWARWPHIIHTSWSHSDSHHKARVVVPLLRPVASSGWARVFFWAVKQSPTIDRQCSDPSRVFYVPSHPVDATGAHSIVWEAGGAGFLDLDPERLPMTPTEQAQEAAKNRPPPRVGYGQGKLATRRAISEALNTTAHARRVAAERLGATISEGGIPRADDIVCPKCARASVHFLLEPGSLKGARCKHKNSCGWTGWIDQLLERQ